MRERTQLLTLLELPNGINEWSIYSSLIMTVLRTTARLAATFSALTAMAMAADWAMFGHDPQRSGWAMEEAVLSPANVSYLSSAAVFIPTGCAHVLSSQTGELPNSVI